MKHTIYFLDIKRIYKSFDIEYIIEREICVVRFTTKRFHIACNIGMRNIYHLLQRTDTYIHRYIKNICRRMWKGVLFKTYQLWNVEMIFLNCIIFNDK